MRPTRARLVVNGIVFDSEHKNNLPDLGGRSGLFGDE